jgi:hypothetical protein
MDIANTILSFLSIPVVQVCVGLLASAFFYWLARRDSRREAKELKRHSIMMMNAMEAQGWVKWVRDENGDPTGRVIEGSVHIRGRGNVRARGNDTDRTQDRENQ